METAIEILVWLGIVAVGLPLVTFIVIFIIALIKSIQNITK